MTLKEVKQWLSRSYHLRKRKEELERARKETYERVTSITAGGGGSVSGSKDPHKFDALVAINAELDSQIANIDRAQRDILRAIDELDDISYQRVLFLRYYEHMTWDDIAMNMSYAKRTVFRIHGKALAAIEPIVSRKLSLNVTIRQ